eukprot:GHVR01187975.1.p3 GENE.GHVR01187975.1~~GHVR01187975.1.p3  ORF type:complete len:220 (-),score=14.24 GHVR01187975.1:409-1068(-)
MSEYPVTGLEMVLRANKAEGIDQIVNTGLDPQSHLRRFLEWRAKTSIRARVTSNETILRVDWPQNRWADNSGGHYGQLNILVKIGAQYRVWDIEHLNRQNENTGTSSVSAAAWAINGATNVWQVIFDMKRRSPVRIQPTRVGGKDIWDGSPGWRPDPGQKLGFFIEGTVGSVRSTVAELTYPGTVVDDPEDPEDPVGLTDAEIQKWLDRVVLTLGSRNP